MRQAITQTPRAVHARHVDLRTHACPRRLDCHPTRSQSSCEAVLQQLAFKARLLLHRLRFAEDGTPLTSRDWVVRAVGDLLARRHVGSWEPLIKVRGEPRRWLQRRQARDVDYVIASTSYVTTTTLYTQRNNLRRGTHPRVSSADCVECRCYRPQ
jgi:hypothetical protein